MEQPKSQENPQSFYQNLVTSLQATLAPDQSLRKQAEQQLSVAKEQSGYTQTLLQIASDQNLDQQIQLSASIQLSNMIEQNWLYKDLTHAKSLNHPKSKIIIISQAEKQATRGQIIKSLFECQNLQIHKQLVRSLTFMCRCDYPEQWPQITTDIANALASGNDKGVFTGLQVLACLTKKYQFEMQKGREPLFDIAKQSFQLIGPLIDHYLAQTESETAKRIIYLVCKIFNYANQFQLCPFLQDQAVLQPWIQFFKQMLDMQVPSELEEPTSDSDEIAIRDKTIEWKIKAIAAKLTYRIISKYTELKYVDKKQERQFIKDFTATHSVTWLESHLQLLLRKKARFVGSKTLNFALKTVMLAPSIDPQMAKLKPFVATILQETVIPIMLVSHSDVLLFDDDPIEYIRKCEDNMETIYSPKNLCAGLVQSICRYKSKTQQLKPDYLCDFLTFASNNMSEYAEQKARGAQPDWRIKEALLFAVGSLQRIVCEHEDLNRQMEALLVTHVLPELASEQPLLRSRACWVYGQYGQYSFVDRQHVTSALDGVFKGLSAEQLPVRVAAAISLSMLLQNDDAVALIRPSLQILLRQYLKIMNQVDYEELIESFEKVVVVFKNQMLPFAIEICQQLVFQYKRCFGFNRFDKSIANTDQGSEEQDDDGTPYVAMSSISAIGRVIHSIYKDEAMMRQVEPIVLPILKHTITPSGVDGIEEGLSILSCILQSSKNQVSAQMWELFPLLLEISLGREEEQMFCMEILPSVTNVLQKYIIRGRDMLFQICPLRKVSYLHQACNFVQQILAMEPLQVDQRDCMSAICILLVILENYPGKLDETLPQLINIIFTELKGSFSNNNKSPVLDFDLDLDYYGMLWQCMAMCFFNNSQVTLQTLEQSNQSLLIINNWVQFAPKIRLEYELRRNIFGFCSILRTPSDSISPSIKDKLPMITKQLGILSDRTSKVRTKVLESNEKMYERLMQSDDEATDDEDQLEDFLDMKGECKCPDCAPCERQSDKTLDGYIMGLLRGNEEQEAPDAEETMEFSSKLQDDIDTQDTMNKVKQSFSNCNEGESQESDSSSDYEPDDLDYLEDGYNNFDRVFDKNFPVVESSLSQEDELFFLKQTLETIHGADPQAFQYLTSAQTQEEAQKMSTSLAQAQALKEREKTCKDKIDTIMQLQEKLVEAMEEQKNQ